MTTIANGWYNANDQRAYPLDEFSTLMDDAGVRLSPSLLADANIRFPRSLGDHLFLSSFTISPTGLVSATILACTGSPAESQTVGVFTPVASIAVTRPKAYRPYPVQAYAPGVSGWVVFGKSVSRSEPVAHRMSLPVQATLCPRASRPYSVTGGLTSLGVFGSSPALQGVIEMLGGGDLKVSKAQRTIGGNTVDVLLFELDGTSDVFTRYAGPCASRPENDNCPRPVVRSVGGATPDCNGNIELEIRTPDGQVVLAEMFAVQTTDGGVLNEGTLVIEYGLGLADVCPPTVSLPIEGGLPPMPQPEGSSSSGGGSSSEGTGCAPFVLPFEDDFSNLPWTSCYWEDPIPGCPELALPFEDSFEDDLWTACFWITPVGST